MLWVLVKKAKEDKGAVFKGATVSVPPLTYQFSREHILGWTVEETAPSPSDKQNSTIYHAIWTLPIMAYAEFRFSFSFHSTQLKIHSYPFQRTGMQLSPFHKPYLTQHFELVLLPLRVYKSISWKKKPRKKTQTNKNQPRLKTQHGRLKAHSLQDNIFLVMWGSLKEVGNLNVNGMGERGTGALFFHS